VFRAAGDSHQQRSLGIFPFDDQRHAGQQLQPLENAAQRPIALGSRNQYDAGVQQSVGRWVLVDVSYFRKYTRNAYDFDALFGTPITFPIGWKQSKLDGISARINTVEIHELRVYATMGHANARFFGPENGGLIFNSNLAVGADRIHILAPGSENPDHNPPRATSRHIFNLGVGSDNLFRRERLRTTIRFTVLNLSNKAALYNFLSPFSGTHWVEPRMYQVQLGWAL
jgi:hypothetical protein